MSILIEGMEMPKTCKECIFSRYILGEWFCRTTTTLDDDGTELWESVGENGNSHRADFCPLIPIPPHGRLIDADALEKKAQKRLLTCEKYDNQFQKPYEVMRAIALAPTIIPAESEGE